MSENPTTNDKQDTEVEPEDTAGHAYRRFEEVPPLRPEDPKTPGDAGAAGAEKGRMSG